MRHRVLRRTAFIFCLAYQFLQGSPSRAQSTSAVVGWGKYVFIEDSKLQNLTTFGPGDEHGLGIKSGQIVAWGRNGSGQCILPEPNSGFSAVAGGSAHTLALKSDGSIVAWGDNYAGQCNVPAPNSGFIAIAAARSNSMGLKGDGSIVAWGSTTDLPAQNSGFVAIAQGGNHRLALKADGTITAWGNNSAGQCNVPAPNSGFLAVACGSGFSMGLRSDQTIAVWGGPDPYYGANGGFVAIAAHEGLSLGLKANGSIVIGGFLDFWRTLPLNGPFAAAACGADFIVARKMDGTVVVWGPGNGSAQINVPEPNRVDSST